MMWELLPMGIGMVSMAAMTLKLQHDNVVMERKFKDKVYPGTGSVMPTYIESKPTERDKLVALVVQNMKENPRNWETIEETHQWRKEFWEGYRNRVDNIYLRRHHCADIGSSHKHKVYINDVMITNLQWKVLAKLFDQRSTNVEVARLTKLAQDRIAQKAAQKVVKALPKPPPPDEDFYSDLMTKVRQRPTKSKLYGKDVVQVERYGHDDTIRITNVDGRVLTTKARDLHFDHYNQLMDDFNEY